MRNVYLDNTKFILITLVIIGHIIVGFIIGLIGAYLLGAPFGFGLSCLAGMAKEAYDKISGKGTVEGLDALATSGGGLIGAGIFLISGV